MKKYNDYSLSRREYYERLITPKNVSFFNELFNVQKKVLPVDVPIIFRDLNFGAVPQAALKLFGEPRYVQQDSGISSLILFYKENISTHKIITQLHFLREEFFYACYSFRHKTPEETMAIRKMLFEKYSRMNGDTAEKYDHMIDKNNNIISVHDHVNFNIVYLWGDLKVKNAVSENIRSVREREEMKIRQKQEELLRKL